MAHVLAPGDRVILAADWPDAGQHWLGVFTVTACLAGSWMESVRDPGDGRTSLPTWSGDWYDWDLVRRVPLTGPRGDGNNPRIIFLMPRTMVSLLPPTLEPEDLRTWLTS